MRDWTYLPFILAAMLIVAAARDASAGGVGISIPQSPTNPAPETVHSPFKPYQPGPSGTVVSRDFEFQWDEVYPFVDLQTLDSLAATLASRKKNPFGAPYPDIQLVHDYFNFQNRTYNTDSDFPGFMLGDPTYPPLDRQHADYYIYLPGHSGYMGGTTNSQFEGAKEDSITGH